MLHIRLCAFNMKVNIAEFWSLPGPMISTLLSELMPGPGTNKWGPDTRQTTPSIMVIPGINNLRAQLGGCIELSSHKTSVKCGHINTDTDQTTSGGMLKCWWQFWVYWHVDSKFRHVECKFRHVAVLTRPQTLSLIIFQISAACRRWKYSQVGNEVQQQMPTNAVIDFIHK